MSSLKNYLGGMDDTVWTNDKAGRIDADISSRAPASTALSTATWTNTRAGYLDAPISSAGGEPIVTSIPKNTGWNPDYMWSGCLAAYHSSSTLTDMLNISPSGGGYLFGVFCRAGSSIQSTQIQIIIDGTTIINDTRKNNANGVCVIPPSLGEVNTSYPNFTKIRFNNSLRIRASTGQNSYIMTYVSYALT